MVWLQQSHKRVQSHNCWCCTSARFVDDFHPKCSFPYRSCLGAKWIFPGSTNWLQPGDWSCTEAGAGHALLFSDKPKGSQVSAARAGGIVTFPSSLPAAPLAEPADKLLWFNVQESKGTGSWSARNAANSSWKNGCSTQKYIVPSLDMCWT